VRATQVGNEYGDGHVFFGHTLMVAPGAGLSTENGPRRPGIADEFFIDVTAYIFLVSNTFIRLISGRFFYAHVRI
jgi:hypothetical protein